jgi:hypothetical protein
MNSTWKNVCNNARTEKFCDEKQQEILFLNKSALRHFLYFELLVENTDIYEYIYVKAFEHTVAISTQKFLYCDFFCSQLSSLMGLWVYHS